MTALNVKGEGYALDSAGDCILNKQSIPLDDLGRCALKAMRLPVKGAALTGSEQSSTDYKLPAGAVIQDVLVNVITAETTGTTKTLDVGTLSSESGGDADGFLDGVSVASTGVKQGSLSSDPVTLGALLKEAVAAGDSETADVRKPYPTGAARTVSFKAGSSGFTTLVADIFVVYLDVTGS